MTPPPGYLHSNAVSRLVRLLTGFLIDSGDKGTVYVPRAGIMSTPDSWLEPDSFYLAAGTKARSDPKYPQYFTTADLVVEVISPSTAIYDRNTKADTYAALGVKELWLVDEAAGIVEQRILQGDQYGQSVVLERDDYLRSVILPGFEVKVSSIFDD